MRLKPTNRKYFMHEANPKADRKYRQEGIRVWNQIVRRVRDLIQKDNQEAKKTRLSQMSKLFRWDLLEQQSPGLGYADFAPVARLISDIKYIDLDVGFASRQQGSAIGAGAWFQPKKTEYGQNEIVVFGLDNEVGKKSWLDQPMLSRSNIASNPYAQAFVHEFVHYMDSKRYKNPKYNKMGTIGKMQKDMASYFNDPKEFNAHTQDILATIEKFYVENYFTWARKYELNPKSADKQWVDSKLNALKKYIDNPQEGFKSVWDHIIQAKMAFVEKLTPENRKKLQQRVYQFYKEVLVPKFQTAFKSISKTHQKQQSRPVLQKFRDFFTDDVEESIVDAPRRKYCPQIFDNPETDEPKIKDEVRRFIENKLKSFLSIAPIVDYQLIGSILTHRYNEDSDLDINVLFDVPNNKEQIQKLLSQKTLQVSGELLPGTKHPVNFYVVVDPDYYKKAAEYADAVFDIRGNRFLRKPDERQFSVDEYLKAFEEKVNQIDLLKGQLKRHLVDFKELQSLAPEDAQDLSSHIESKIYEIENDVNKLVDIYVDTKEKRNAAFANPLDPVEIQKYGQKNRLPDNVIYKLLEKYYYLDFLAMLKKIIGDDRRLSPDELSKLKTKVEGVKKFKKFVKEVHYQDYYHKNFELFRKKYLKQLKTGEIADYYINYTNHTGDRIDKSMNAKPDHGDPVGIYGYPIEYVLKHPADVWYGANAKFLRVLKHLKKDKTLYLQDVSENNVIRYITKIYNVGWGEANEIYSRTLKWLRRWGRQNRVQEGTILFFNVQHDMQAEPTKDERGWSPEKPIYPIRSQIEQSKILLDLGFLSVVDTARTNKKAIINDREPEQILFLRRDAFDVVETIPMNQKSQYVQTTTDPEKIERKLIADIAKAMDGDKIVSGPERSGLGGASYYWTKNGRRIVVDFNWTPEYFDYMQATRKMGEKKHKEMKLHDMKQTEVEVQSEYGPISWTWTPDTKFKDIVKDFEQDWKDAKKKEKDPKWKPETRTSFMKRKEDERTLSIFSRWFKDFGFEDWNEPDAVKERGYEINSEEELAAHLKKRHPELADDIEQIYQEWKSKKG